MKIIPRAFALSLLWVTAVSVAMYFVFLFVCKSFAPSLLPFVFLISTLLFAVLFYLAAVHYKTFSLSLNGQKLLISRGFIIKRKRQLNLKYTTSVKYASTPLMRFLGLSNLLLIFEGSLCLLPLLKARDAELLYESVLKISDKNEEI